MQFHSEMIDLIRSGAKTQTRRPCKLDDELNIRPSANGSVHEVMDAKGRAKWTQFKRYSVCPGRGKPSVDLIRIVDIRPQPVFAISEDDAKAEGFSSRAAFLEAWKRLYPKSPPNDYVWVLTFDRK